MTTPLLPGSVQNAAPGLSGFDTNTVLNATSASCFVNNGYAFCFRYLSRGHGQQPGDLSYTEAKTILESGLALGAVQHVSMPGWTPSASLGTEYGTNAAYNAASIGLPAGMNLWMDLEGIASGTSAQTVIAYSNAWYDAVFAAGYIPGIYVGANCILTGDQLYNSLKYQHYWKSLSQVPSIPVRGYQLVQSFSKDPVCGVSIDKDSTMTDQSGGTVLWLKMG
ncbi:DUF1906 domain-containing protein [uncultured Fluviicola sp.]|uniref:DUF1906 domain-containing protein n=1 Tax=uncultured Fluviicola sp. TaxID=463303 RepID=UPI0025FB28C7|nr:DUF1906 domain-containing protein [uncultured Fluviicola sp.]